MVKTDLPSNFSVEVPNAERVTKKDIEKGVALSIMEKAALKIATKLGADLRNT